MTHGIILGQIPQEAIHARSADTATTATTANSATTATTANSAKKLSNSRTFLTNLASTSSASFNGTANVTPGVTGILRITNGGTGLSSNPSMLVNLASTAAANVLTASPRPGVTGVLPVANGGTGTTSLDNLKSLLSITDIQIFTNQDSSISVPKKFKFIILMPRNYYSPGGLGSNYSSYDTGVIVNTGDLNNTRIFIDNHEYSVYISSNGSYYSIRVDNCRDFNAIVFI